MQMQNEPTSIIVAEYGADGSAWASRFAVGTPSVLSLAQARDESPIDFAQRVRTVVASFVAGGGNICRGVLVGGGGTGADLLSARSLAIRALVTPMAGNGEGTVVLDAAGPDRFSMMALATTVSSQIGGTGVTVTATSSRVAHVA